MQTTNLLQERLKRTLDQVGMGKVNAVEDVGRNKFIHTVDGSIN
jgi:hypothetical protein